MEANPGPEPSSPHGLEWESDVLRQALGIGPADNNEVACALLDLALNEEGFFDSVMQSVGKVGPEIPPPAGKPEGPMPSPLTSVAEDLVIPSLRSLPMDLDIGPAPLLTMGNLPTCPMQWTFPPPLRFNVPLFLGTLPHPPVGCATSQSGEVEGGVEGIRGPFCPFGPDCAFRDEDAGRMLRHVDRIYVAKGQFPERIWLMSVDQWICTSCMTLVPCRTACRSVACVPAPQFEDPYQWAGVLPPPPLLTDESTAWAESPVFLPPASPEDVLHVLGLSQPTMKHIPQKALPCVTLSFARCLEAFNMAPSCSTLRALMLWPQVVLRVPPRGG